MQLETGSGKTALSFVIACNSFFKGLKVLLINVSDELTFRDFKKADSCSKALEMPVSFLQNDGQEARIPAGITYLSFKAFSDAFYKKGMIDP